VVTGSGDVWHVRVDPDACIGSGLCAGTAPGVFHLVDGRSTVVSEEVPAGDSVLAAAECCPVEAITVRRADGTVVT
jgi:ferredoxin